MYIYSYSEGYDENIYILPLTIEYIVMWRGGEWERDREGIKHETCKLHTHTLQFIKYNI